VGADNWEKFGSGDIHRPANDPPSAARIVQMKVTINFFKRVIGSPRDG
jgi:hypothetical protein